MKLKVGDLLYCHTSIRYVVEGEYYTITPWRHIFAVMGSDGEKYAFKLENYKENYYTISELRQMKIKKLNENNKNNTIR